MSLKLDAIAAVRFYIDRICSDQSSSGMKVLLLDSVTTKVVSMVYSQTQVLEKEVYLVESLESLHTKPHANMMHLKAAVFVQPTESNLTHILNEIRDPKFSEYHIYFSNIVPPDILMRLARADENEVIKQVQEYYAEFMAVNDDLFHLGIENSIALSSAAQTVQSNLILERNTHGIISALLAFKRRPSQIRYQGSSPLARRLATQVTAIVEKDDIFDMRKHDGPLLLILDRRDDPVTPLLTQWTYQAMVHHLLGINFNRVSLKGVPGVQPDLEEVVLSTTSDPFFAKNLNANFGDLGLAVKRMLDDYQHKAKKNENIDSIEDMQAFLDRYPAFRSQAINVSKHVAIMSELARLTDRNQLLSVSQLEQEIATSSDHSSHRQLLMDKLNDSRISKDDKLRLALLYTIKYESYDEAAQIRRALIDGGVAPHESNLIELILNYAGETRRSQGLFSAGGIIAK